MRDRTWSEFEIINRFFSVAQNNLPGDIIAGIGDDAAVIAYSKSFPILVTHDMMVEGIHFKSSWMSPYALGRKLVKINISDLAAMGGIPDYALLSIALPSTLDEGWLEGFSRGIKDTLSEFNLTLIGGDTSLSPGPIVVAMTILGKSKYAPPLLRHSPKVHDKIYVSGTLGDAACGLAILNHYENQPLSTNEAKYLINRHLDPSPRLDIGQEIASKHIASATIDISDGMVADLGHLLEKTSLGAEIRFEDIPLSKPFREIAHLYHSSPEEFVLSGGEDYELLFTSPYNLKQITALAPDIASLITSIGVITEDPGIKILKNGKSVSLHTKGFQHKFHLKG